MTRVAVETVSDFEQLLQELTGFDASLDAAVVRAISTVIRAIGSVQPIDPDSISRRFYGRINEKLDANRDVRQLLYRVAADSGFTFNYLQKRTISRAIDESDLSVLDEALKLYGVPHLFRREILYACAPVSWETTRLLLHAEARKPSKLRKAVQRTVEADIFASAAGSLVWVLWPSEELYKVFGGGGAGTGARAYMNYLGQLRPELFNRERTLSIRFIEPSGSRRARRQSLARWVASEYEALANHGFLALIVDASCPANAWTTVNDVTVFAERFKETPLKQMFFRSADVQSATMTHIAGLDPTKARFDLLNEGFTYRDVFILRHKSGVVARLVLVMQKNVRDETTIPCPACRSIDIEGNSYPMLGVRSWECRNRLCPNRSIYNRGNRFQFRSIVQQAAIEDPRNAISAENVKRWRKDILDFDGDAEIVNTLILHYSIADDGVTVLGLPSGEVVKAASRKISFDEPDPVPLNSGFWMSSFFERFVVPITSMEPPATRAMDDSKLYELFEGDSTEVLRTIPSDMFDRAITSPPYFNAREYAQWPNLYCYLHDMYINAVEVFRTLKPGGIYAYNIFDYFDNERIVTFSAMGRKRIPLGALMGHIFERVGFEFLGVVPWDKGDIHGKRGFNGGNYSPYYQSPFNCWEHVLIVRKPRGRHLGATTLPHQLLRSVIRVAPVFKIVRGVNTYGHTAPFPEQLPDLFMEGLPAGAVVLDPFAGSGTTARAAMKRGLRAVLIERDPAYAALARTMIEECIVGRSGLLF